MFFCSNRIIRKAQPLDWVECGKLMENVNSLSRYEKFKLSIDLIETIVSNFYKEDSELVRENNKKEYLGPYYGEPFLLADGNKMRNSISTDTTAMLIMCHQNKQGFRISYESFIEDKKKIFDFLEKVLKNDYL